MPPPETSSGTRLRYDIEGLRAVAALLVAIYHIWLGRVSGGVDVFFVIAGFLITATLLRQFERSGQIHPGRFLGRLLVRLLPNALTVLLAVGIATLLLLPITRRAEVFQEIIASALYVENWQLIANSVDYLAREQADSPVQHFWAMSIQGQFYLIWLALALITTLIALRATARRRLAMMVALVTVASFVFSIYLTWQDQPVAYFHTATRVWEFGVGSLVATGLLAGPRLTDRGERVAGWTGLGLILATGLVMPVSDLFPGVAALMPVLGAVLILVSGRPVRGSAARLLATRPMVSLGGVAYAIYLWHWPVLIFYLQIRGWDQAGPRGGLLVLGVSIALAYASTVLIERPIRRLHWTRFGGWAAPIAGVTATVVVVGMSTMVIAQNRPTMPTSDGVHLAHWSDPGSTPDFTIAPSDDPYPGILVAADDRPPATRDGCNQRLRESEVLRCIYGDEDADRRMVLVGGSHSLHWQPAMEEIAVQTGWQLEVITKSGCRQGISLVGSEYTLYGEEEINISCREWDAEVREILRTDPPDLIVGSTTVVREGEGDNLPAYYVEFWTEMDQLEVPMLGIRTTPRAFENRVTCIAEHGPDSPECDLPRSVTLAEVNPADALAEELTHFTVVDLSDWLCDETNCPPVIEDTIVFHDRHHLTGTFSRALAQPLFREAPYLFLDE